MIAMALQELEPERIEEDQGDALVSVDAASHLSRDVREGLHAAQLLPIATPGLARTSAGERVLAGCIAQGRGATTPSTLRARGACGHEKRVWTPVMTIVADANRAIPMAAKRVR